jgi:hypothetical protein
VTIDMAGLASLISAVAALGALGLSARNAKKIQEVHVSVNSRMDELLKLQGASEHAKGVLQGAQDERDNPR